MDDDEHHLVMLVGQESLGAEHLIKPQITAIGQTVIGIPMNVLALQVDRSLEMIAHGASPLPRLACKEARAEGQAARPVFATAANAIEPGSIG